MAKFVHDTVMDTLLAFIADHGDTLFVLPSSQVVSFAAADAVDLAKHTMTESISGADYAITDNGNGRRLTISQQVAIAVIANGTATHIAIGDSAAGTILLQTTCPSVALTIGNTVTVNAFTHDVDEVT